MVSLDHLRRWPALAVACCSCVGCGRHTLPARTAEAAPSAEVLSAPVSGAVPATPRANGPLLDDSGDSDAESESDQSESESDESESESDESNAAETLPPENARAVPHPLDGWSDERIEHALTRDLTSLGPMSIGTPNAGALVNGVQAVASPLYTLVSPSGAWGTKETIDYLNTAVQAVHDEFPDTPPLALGDIGARHGGPLRPHISHQAGRDLDVSFYYRDGTRWYARGTRENLDFPRLWAFVRAIIAKTDIEMILLDRGLQRPLQEYALSIGEDPTWLEQIFQGKGGVRAIIHHAPGHDTHLHLRFFNPIAQETARRCYPALVRHNLVRAPEQYLTHRAKKNETLAMIAKKYGSSVRAIRDANGLRSNLIHEQAVYRIPVSGASARIPQLQRARIPARRPPPARQEPSAVSSQLSTREQE